MEYRDIQKNLEERKFNWINVALIGAGATFTVILQKGINIWIWAALLGFLLVVIIETLSLVIIEHSFMAFADRRMSVRLAFHWSLVIDAVLVISSILSLAWGVLLVVRPTT